MLILCQTLEVKCLLTSHYFSAVKALLQTTLLFSAPHLQTLGFYKVNIFFGMILQINLATVGSLYSSAYIVLHVCVQSVDLPLCVCWISMGRYIAQVSRFVADDVNLLVCVVPLL